MSILNTTYNGLDIEVHYTVEGGHKETLTSPGEELTVEIDKVVYQGIDVSPFMEKLGMDMLEGECLADATESAVSDLADRAEYRRESARDDALEWGGE
jgi:hypothetical protein